MYNVKNKLLNAIFIVAIYIRLSKEDDKDGESESVQNQKTLLTRYVEENGYKLYKIYIDDGYTGTNFNRPAFKEMIQDIEAGKINMVITKDLSRLGRDYIETGEYVEKYFPMKRVRYVSLLDGIDTSLDTTNNEIAPFKAILNDMYSRDNSKKIRAHLETMQKSGKWVGGCTPLGYMPDPKDKNHLIINEEEAPIVRRIFDLAKKGESAYKIREIFNTEKVPTFSMLRNRMPVDKTFHATRGVWSVKTITGILSNQLYTGDMVQNRRSRISYKIRKVVPNSKDEWIIVPNTHEALVDKDTFNLIQKTMKNNAIRNTNKEVRSLDGILFCKECGHRITIDKPRNGHTYIACNYYRMYSKLKLCTSHGFNYDNLENNVIEYCKNVFAEQLDKEKLAKNLNNSYKSSNPRDVINGKIEKINFTLEKNKEKLDNMYLDKLEGKISSEMYDRISKKISNEIDELEQEKQKYEEKLGNVNCEIDDFEKIRDVINEFMKMENPTREIMLKLIKKIEVHNDKTLDIYFNFKLS